MLESKWDVKCPKCQGEDSADCPECKGSKRDDPVRAIQRIKAIFNLDNYCIGPREVEILIKAGEELERLSQMNVLQEVPGKEPLKGCRIVRVLVDENIHPGYNDQPVLRQVYFVGRDGGAIDLGENWRALTKFIEMLGGRVEERVS